MAQTKISISMGNLTKEFDDVVAVDDLSLDVWKGELFGLLGPNGAGKTTTVGILCGLIEPTKGHAVIEGCDVQKERMKVKQIIGVCPQETAIYPYLTGMENIEFFGDLYCIDKSVLRSRAAMLLDKMGLAQDAKRRAEKYSGGMKRRLSLILSLIHDPSVLFLDEPTVGMDPQSRRAVWDFLRELKSRGKTIFLTTHYMEEAETLCDRVGIIDRGKLIALGSPKSLIAEHHVENLESLFIKLTGRKIREEI
ncbi:MAG: ABC transporter ATP-binding protein [Methanomassiliicoccales archaeon]